MNLDVTQDNLYLFLPEKTADWALILAEQEHISFKEALKRVYLSHTYKKLEIENSKLWHYGPVALYEEYLEFH